MRRILFLQAERRGSTFCMSLFLGKPGRFAGKGCPDAFGEISYPGWLPTVPSKQCRFWHEGAPQGHAIDDLIKKRPLIDVPELHVWSPPANLSPSFYNSLPENDWRFIYLFRDPRNSISSLAKRGENMGASADLCFYAHCGYIKNELQSISQMLPDPRFRILFFEDLAKDPINTAENLFAFMGFQPDKAVIHDVIKRYTKSFVNSSYKDKGRGSNQRWATWPEEWASHYRQQVEPYLYLVNRPEYLDW